MLTHWPRSNHLYSYDANTCVMFLRQVVLAQFLRSNESRMVRSCAGKNWTTAGCKRGKSNSSYQKWTLSTNCNTQTLFSTMTSKSLPSTRFYSHSIVLSKDHLERKEEAVHRDGVLWERWHGLVNKKVSRWKRLCCWGRHLEDLHAGAACSQWVPL